jgi:hypothetical protein
MLADQCLGIRRRLTCPVTKNETFEVADEIFYQKFNSSDIHGA